MLAGKRASRSPEHRPRAGKPKPVQAFPSLGQESLGALAVFVDGVAVVPTEPGGAAAQEYPYQPLVLAS